MSHKISGRKLVGSSIQTSTSNRRSTTPRTTGGQSRIGTRETRSGYALRTIETMTNGNGRAVIRCPHHSCIASDGRSHRLSSDQFRRAVYVGLLGELLKEIVVN